MSERESNFTPEWSFMDDPVLRELQLSLDACYGGVGPETQNARNEARAKFLKIWPEIYSVYAAEPNKRKLLIRFLRKNMTTLDRGGVWKGNDPQVSALRESNAQLISQHEKEYWNIVQEIETGL